ncbi:MAG: hypothetical protein VW270_18440 [Candidatus Poseidoniales archaeon]
MNVKWYVVTKDNMNEFLEQFEKKNGSVVFFAISVPDYENMSLNMAELRRYIEQQKAIVVYYEDQITKQSESINKETEGKPQE